MEILFWLTGSFDRRGPSEHLLNDMIEALYKQGNTVHVLQKNTSGPKAPLPEQLLQLGVKTTRIDCTPPQKNNLITRFLVDMKYVLQCKKWLIINNKFDRVFLQSSNVAGMQVHVLRKLLKNVPITFNVQDIFPENAVYSGTLSKDGFPYRVLSAIQRYAYRHANRIITISEDMKDQLIEIGTSADKIEVVYNWSYQDEPYDLTKLDYTRVEPLFDKAKFNVVYAGNIGRMQNVEIVIRAAAQMRENAEIAFHVFGEGVYKDKLVALAQQLNADNVTFHPMLDSKDAPALYASADVNVIPLAKDIYRTALPSKTATCLACGKPIIFAIGKESKFGQRMAAEFHHRVIEAKEAEQLCAAVQDCKDRKRSETNSILFESIFSRTNNSNMYARLIVKKY